MGQNRVTRLQPIPSVFALIVSLEPARIGGIAK